MHNSVKQFIKEVRRTYPYKFRNKKVLEVGSHNINGSPRKYFWFCRYTGVDISNGKGVDFIGEFNSIAFKSEYQVVISTEMLEHDKHWKESLLKMYTLLEPKGLLIITCAAPDRPEHGTKKTTPHCSPDTTDYYRNLSTEDFRSVLPNNLFSDYILRYDRGESDLQFYGLKREPHITSNEIYKKLLS